MMVSLGLAAMIGFGTYPFQGDECEGAVRCAIQCGYRIIDTATLYQNFDAVAKALEGQKRGDFFLISKVWMDAQRPRDLKRDLERALKELRTDYVDLYFVHWPNSKIPIEDTLHAMDELREQGKIRYIGLSNVTVNHLNRALEVGVPIHSVQVEMHPHFCDFELLEFCEEHSIRVQAWGPLGRGKLANDKELRAVGKKYGKTAAQVALRWNIQHGSIPLPGSKNEKHIRENHDIEDFALTAEEMGAIDKKARRGTRERYDIDEFDFSYDECWPKK